MRINEIRIRKMEIRGRKVEAVTYENLPIVNAYVRLNEGDCRRKREPSYVCWDTCESSLVMARFAERQPISIKALLMEKLQVHPGLAGGISCVEDFAKFEDKGYLGYACLEKGAGKVLLHQAQIVAAYNPCGFTNDLRNCGEEVSLAVTELVERVDEVYNIAETLPLAKILDDRALASQIDNPAIMMLMKAVFGEEGLKQLQALKALREK